eukprot:Colp12_sorted_trinity150504_noHs@26176
MGKRYFCDYCNKSFMDNPLARKRHLESANHQLQVKLHYDSFKDPSQLLAEELKKQPCKRFQTTGTCDFGGRCKYGHVPKYMTQEQLFASFATGPSANVTPTANEFPVPTDPDHQPFVAKLLQLPGGIPPSLMPPPPGGYDPSIFVEEDWC